MLITNKCFPHDLTSLSSFIVLCWIQSLYYVYFNSMENVVIGVLLLIIFCAFACILLFNCLFISVSDIEVQQFCAETIHSLSGIPLCVRREIQCSSIIKTLLWYWFWKLHNLLYFSLTLTLFYGQMRWKALEFRPDSCLRNYLETNRSQFSSYFQKNSEVLNVAFALAFWAEDPSIKELYRPN